MLTSHYSIEHPDQIDSPALIVFRDLLFHNLDTMIDIAGDASRLRPHCKTHKISTIIRAELERGITKHKAATFAEAEMLALTGVTDIFLAYNMVGPNVTRAVTFRQTFPDVQLCVNVDSAQQIEALGSAMQAAGTTIDVVLDFNPGQNRTGLPVGETARELYRQLHRTPGIHAAGFHVYDGHVRISSPEERTQVVGDFWNSVSQLRDELIAEGFPVERVICGGTPTFPVYAAMTDPCIELSPGTCVYHDAGYGELFPDLARFIPAALVFTRVVSRPRPNLVTFDIGTKAVASDPAMGSRVVFPEIPDGIQRLQNEEHLVVETESADNWSPGDWTVAIPRHVCPTSVLYPEAIIIAEGQIVDRWKIDARDRKLTI